LLGHSTPSGKGIENGSGGDFVLQRRPFATAVRNLLDLFLGRGRTLNRPSLRTEGGKSDEEVISREGGQKTMMNPLATERGKRTTYPAGKSEHVHASKRGARRDV